MPFCPTCRTEYRPGFSTCADCGSALVADLPPLERDAAPVGTPVAEVAVATYPTWLEASMAQGVLEAEGIPVVLKATGAGYGEPGTEQLLPHALIVRAGDASRARALLGE